MSYIAQIEVEIVADTTDGTPKLTAAGKLAVLIGDVVKHNATLRTKNAGVVGVRVVRVSEKDDAAYTPEEREKYDIPEPGINPTGEVYS